jgi:methyl-accepting chemotaxis protein
VVAGEIGKLAEECKNAVKFTSALIGGTINAVNEGVIMANESADYFNEIVDKSMKTNEVIEKVTIDTRNQAEQLNNTLSFLQNISFVIESNSTAAGESSLMSTEFISQSEKLEELIREYILISNDYA